MNEFAEMDLSRGLFNRDQTKRISFQIMNLHPMRCGGSYGWGTLLLRSTDLEKTRY